MAAVVVLNYGMGNVHSIVKALRLYLPDVRYSRDEQEIAQAKALVLPGDGAFSAAMTELKGALQKNLLAFIASGKPLLGICIGFQILFEDSEETSLESSSNLETCPKVKGLAILPGYIRKFSFANTNTRIPHIGWNKLISVKQQDPKQYMYFIHSYRATQVPKQYIEFYCDYAGDLFPAVVRKDNVLAVQFHPEKSGTVGLKFIEKWTQSLGRGSAQKGSSLSAAVG